MTAKDETLNHFVAGFVSGEGSFFISAQHSRGHTLKTQVTAGFSVKVRDDDRELINTIWRALGCVGHIYGIDNKRYQYDWDPLAPKRNDAVLLLVRRLTDLTTRVIPFFDRYPLRGRKSDNYELWKQAIQMMEQRAHLTLEGLQAILEIKAQMNRY